MNLRRMAAPVALFLAGGSTLLTAGCASQTFIDDVAFLRRHADVILLRDRGGNPIVAVCPHLQGRAMTSTATGRGGLSYGWLNHELISSRETRPHINAYGGEDRFWLGPEGGQFSIFFPPGAPFTLENWQTPSPIDSESFDVAKQGTDAVLLRKKMSLKNASGTVFHLEVQREIRLMGDGEPARHLGIEPGAEVRMAAFESRNRVTNTGNAEWKKETGLLSIWILGMFNPSPETTVVIPYREGPVEQLGPIVNDAYFGKVPRDRMRIDKGVIFFKGDGQFRSKIGVSPQRSLGVLGSFDANAHALTIVQFNQPKNVLDYVNSMWEIQKEPYAGDASNSYNDGPATPGAEPLGPFYELESSSPALALRPGLSYQHIHRTFHFQGPYADLDDIARRVFGVGLERIATVFEK